jgi:glycosyltransferase involved in cell wall biosynthesis/peptidoglycan biosynthesis protein MviN/MurJ (putative lipid II flippase)
MKILYCIPTLGNGGAERQLSYLAVELQRMGHEVHVASSRGGPNLERLKSAGVHWHNLGGVSNRDPIIFLRLIRLLRRLRPDIVQTILAPMDIIGGAAALITRTPWILKESSSAPLYVEGLRHKFRTALGRHADGIISNSAGGDAYWQSVRSANSRYVIRNAIPFTDIDETTAEVIRKNGEKVVLFAGRLDAGKNVQNLILALAQIADDVPFTALVCGDGPLRHQLEDLASKAGIAHRVVFTGYVSNIWTLMKGADALVSLSRFEGCPNVVIEAMACGCPLVVSDIPAHREVLNGYGASFVDPDNPTEAGRKIKALLTNGNGLRSRTKAALSNAPEWRVEQVAQLYTSIYHDIATGASSAKRAATTRSLFTQSAWLATLSAINALLALLMTWYVVAHLGVGAQTDAFFASAVIPQFAFMLLTTTLLPVLVPLLATRGEPEFSHDVWSFFTVTGAIFILLAVVLYLSANAWVPWFVPGFTAGAKTLTASLTRIQLVSMILNALIVTLWAAHHARHRFVWVELSAVVANCAGLSFLVLTISHFGIWAAAVNTIFYNSLKLAFLLPILGRFRLPAWRSPVIREALQRLKPLLPGQIYLRTDPALDRFLTSMTGAGTLSLLHVAQQIYASIIILLGKAVVAPMAPKLAVYAREERWSSYRRHYWSRFLLLLAITIVGVLIVIAGAPSLSMFVAELGIGPGNLRTLWLTMVALGGTFIGGALVQATAGAFYGMGNTKTPTKVSTALYTLFIPIKILAFMKFGLIGLAVSMSSYFLTNSVTQFWLLRSKLGSKDFSEHR